MSLFKKIILTVSLGFYCAMANAQYAAIVIDADSGKVLHQVEATRHWFPASLTKVMTLYLTFAALKSGQLSLYDLAPVSNYAASQPNGKLGLRAGETIAIQDAIRAVISRSANDAAVVLAERVAGTEARFAREMTATAHAINMHDSSFFNATGLPHTQQMTTARDMAVLASRVRQDFPEYYHFFSIPSMYFKGHTLPNINKFLKSYPGAEGMKTGFTCASGFNLIAAAQRDGKRVIGVVLGAMSGKERSQLMASMLDLGFQLDEYNGQFYHINDLVGADGGRPPYQLSAHNCNYKDYSVLAKHNDELQEPNAYAAAGIDTLAIPAMQDATVDQSQSTPVAEMQNWTVVLGAFYERAEAEEYNRRVRSVIEELATIGNPAVEQRQVEGVAFWQALWTGIDSMSQASNVCRQLWESDVECSILPAEVMTSSLAP